MKYLKGIINNLLVKDIVIALLIVVLPLLFYLYKLVPIDKQSLNIFGLIINSGGFDNVRFYIWFIILRMYVIMLLYLWYLTCSHWWRFSIFVPLSIEVFKLSTLLNTEYKALDEVEFLKSLFITIPLIIMLIIISKTFSNYSLALDFNNEINQEIDELIIDISNNKTKRVDFFNKEFDFLKNEKNKLSEQEYLKLLLKMRKELLNETLDLQ